MAADISVWSVQVDDQPTRSLFDDIDLALAYLRGYLRTNGGKRATLESRRMNPLRYAAEVELEDGAPIGRETVAGDS